jgi:hypothetical protein
VRCHVGIVFLSDQKGRVRLPTKQNNKMIEFGLLFLPHVIAHTWEKKREETEEGIDSREEKPRAKARRDSKATNRSKVD